MTTHVNRYIGTNGEILIPVSNTTDNTSNLISTSGIYYIAQKSEIVPIVAGNPIGLLLTLTYPATP